MNTNRPSRIEKYRTMITGLLAIIGSNGTITFNGVVTKVADIVAALQSAVDMPAKTVAAAATFHAAVAAEKAANKAANAQYLAVKRWALSAIAPGDLPQLGLEAKQPRKPSVATKAAAQGKARATRAKLGTKGKQQKAAAKAAPDASASPASPAAPTATTPKSS